MQTVVFQGFIQASKNERGSQEQALGQLAAGANEAALDVQALPDGIYLVEVVAGGQRSVVRMVCAR